MAIYTCKNREKLFLSELNDYNSKITSGNISSIQKHL